MDFVCVGKIVNTHGIKGELRIISDFDKKDIIFSEGFKFYIGEGKIEEVLSTYRKHKSFDMVCFKGYNNINEVLKYKGLKIYINRNDLNLSKDDYILDDLIGLTIKDNDEDLGEVIDYVINSNSTLLKVKKDKEYYIPLVDEYIIKVNLDNKEILTKNVGGLML